MKFNYEKYIAPTCALATFIVYLFTLAPGVLQIDSGELAAVQATLGVAHPTGYPLFTLTGFIWSKIFSFGSVIFRLNVLAAIFVAAGNYFFVRSALEILTYRALPKPQVSPKTKKKEAVPVPARLSAGPLNLIAAAAGLGFIAFSGTYWAQSTGVEVYSLHILLLNAILFFTLRAWLAPVSTPKSWIIVSVLLALGFSNHMTTLLITPGIAILFVIRNRITARSLKTAGVMAGAFIAILALMYSYLPLRSSMHPALNWGNTHIGEYFWRHITGQQYQVWMFSSGKAASKNLDLFFRNFPKEFSAIGIGFMVAGMLYGFLRNRTLTFFLLLNSVVTVAYAVNYNIKDIEPYFLLAFISCAMFMVLGLQWVFDFVEAFRQKPALGSIAFGLPVFMIWINFSAVDQSENYMYTDYTREALNSVEENAVIFTPQWDVFVSSAYYFQQVEGLRKDVLIIDRHLLRRSWYYDQLARLHPEVMEPVQPEIKAFREAVMPFERQQKYNGVLIQQRFVTLITAIIAKNYKERPFYIAEEVLQQDLTREGGDVQLPPGATLLPQKYFYRVIAEDTVQYYPMETGYEVDIRFPEKEHLFSRMIKVSVIGVLSNRLAYEMAYGKKEEAKQIWAVLHELDPKLQAPPGME